MIATITKTMTKQELDIYFSANHSTIQKKIKHIKFNKAPQTQWELDELMSFIYLHLVKNLKTLTENNIEAYIIKYANSNCGWKRSDINLLYTVNKIEFKEEIKTDITNEEDEDEMEKKIKLEQEFNHQQTLASIFRHSLQPQERIIFDATYRDGLTIKQMVQKYRTNRTYLTKIRREITNKFKDFVNKEG